MEKRWTRIINEETGACVCAGGEIDKKRELQLIEDGFSLKEVVHQNWDGQSIYYLADKAPKRTRESEIKEELEDLDRELTTRRLEEAICGNEESIQFVKNINRKKEDLRKELEQCKKN